MFTTNKQGKSVLIQTYDVFFSHPWRSIVVLGVVPLLAFTLNNRFNPDMPISKQLVQPRSAGLFAGLMFTMGLLSYTLDSNNNNQHD